MNEMQCRKNFKILALLLIIDIAACRIITKTNHRTVITDENGNKQYRMWTTTDDNESGKGEEFDNVNDREFGVESFPRASQHKDAHLLEEIMRQGMDPIAVAELLRTKEPVIRTSQNAEGHQQTTTYKLEPDGSISRKIITIKPVVISGGYFKQDHAYDPFMQSFGIPQNRPNVLRRKIIKEPTTQKPENYLRNKTLDPTLIKPIEGPVNEWEWMPPRILKPIPNIEREQSPPLPPLFDPSQPLAPPSTFSITTTPQPLPSFEKPIDSAEVWPEFEEVFGESEQPTEKSEPKESKILRNETLGKNSNEFDSSKNSTANLDDLIKSLFQNDTTKSKDNDNDNPLPTTTTAKTTTELKTTTTELPAIETTTVKQSVSNSYLPPTANDGRLVKTYTKTFNSPKIPTSADLDASMLNILEKSGISPDEITTTKEINNTRTITKSRVEPDGKTITTTYTVKTIPDMLGPFNRTKPPMTATRTQIYSSPPISYAPTSFAPAMNPSNPFLFQQLQNPILVYLSNCGLTLADIEASNGEYVKRIADAEGRVLTVTFLLSSVRNDFENEQLIKNSLQPKPIK